MLAEVRSDLTIFARKVFRQFILVGALKEGVQQPQLQGFRRVVSHLCFAQSRLKSQVYNYTRLKISLIGWYGFKVSTVVCKDISLGSLVITLCNLT